MAYLDCEDIVRKALGRKLDEDEINDFFEQAKDLFRELDAGKKADELADAATLAASRKELEAIAKKRATQLNAIKRIEAVRFCLENFRGMEGEGLMALLGGSKFNRAGARLSVDAIGSGLEGKYVGGMLSEVEQLGKGYFELLRKGAMDRQIAEAMWTIDNSNAQAFTGAPEAMEIAKIIHKWQEKIKTDLNRAGAWIGKEPGYIVRQSHDQTKIAAAKAEDWIKYIKERLDWKNTADGKYDPAVDEKAAMKFLHETYYNLATGVHLKFPESAPSLARPSVMGSTAALVSHERILRFKSGGDWFDYNQKFGYGNLREALLHGLSRSARNVALMRVLGPSPQYNLEAILDTLTNIMRRRENLEGVARIDRMRGKLRNVMKVVDGTANIDGNPAWAMRSRFARDLLSMSKLGGALISSLSDAGTFASELSYQGKPFFTSIFNGVMEMLNGRGNADQKKILSMCGVFFDSMSGSVVSRFSGDGTPGKMSAMMNLFFHLNGLTWWTDSWKKAAAFMMAHDLSLEKGLSFGELTHQRRRVLELYQIDEGIWDMLRRRDCIMDDGREYLCPEAAWDIPEQELKDYLASQGKRWTEARGRRLQEQIEERLRTYYRDRVQYAVLEPDARTRSILQQGTSSGTVVGEALRFVTQFKSFPTVFMQRALGRGVFGRSGDAKGFWGATLGTLKDSFIRDGHGERNNFARLFLTMTAFGYASMTIKELLAGKNPREWSRKTLLAAAMQGGGLGIYGDFLFGEKSRMGNSFLENLAGPGLSTVANIWGLGKDITEGNDVKSNAFRTFFNLVPGNNLFWFRTAFDHLIGFELYEMMNPGYLRRMQRRIRKENGQTFWWAPR